MLPLFHAYWAQAVNFMWNPHGLVKGEKRKNRVKCEQNHIYARRVWSFELTFFTELLMALWSSIIGIRFVRVHRGGGNTAGNT